MPSKANHLPVWVTISVLIDLGLIITPFLIINRVRLKSFERKALYCVFGASLLGTLTWYVRACFFWGVA